MRTVWVSRHSMPVQRLLFDLDSGRLIRRVRQADAARPVAGLADRCLGGWAIVFSNGESIILRAAGRMVDLGAPDISMELRTRGPLRELRVTAGGSGIVLRTLRLYEIFADPMEEPFLCWIEGFRSVEQRERAVAGWAPDATFDA